MQAFLLAILLALQLSVLNVSSIPTDHIPDAQEAIATQSGLISSDDCVNNNSLDNDDGCQRSNEHDVRSTTIIPDNPDQLARRLEEVDRLDVAPFLRYSHPKIVSSSDAQHNDEDLISDDLSSLRQVLLIHRHGDRTPYEFGPRDPLRNEPFWKFHGPAYLTNRGKARMFWLGRIVRNRYHEFLGKSVNKNQRISRSSGILRCIESAQVFLAGFLGLNQDQGSEDAEKLIWDDTTTNPLAGLWQPAGIQSVPASFDGMLAGPPCVKLDDEHNKVINSSAEVRAIFNKFQREHRVITEVIGQDMSVFWRWFYASSQLEVERSYFPDKMSAEIMEVYDSIIEAGALAMGAYQSTLTAKRLRSGLLINDMVGHMSNVRDFYRKLNGHSHSTVLKKFVHYSAHDVTLAVLLGMLDSWHRFGAAPPDFSSNIVIELHQDQSEWFVRILYMPHVPTDYVELHLDRCESGHPSKRCTLDKFTQLMRPYMIGSWQAWMKECGNDLEKIDPYVDGP